MVNMADGWREGNCEYPGRSAWNALKELTIIARLYYYLGQLTIVSLK
jgi:hypothetical protein